MPKETFPKAAGPYPPPKPNETVGQAVGLDPLPIPGRVGVCKKA